MNPDISTQTNEKNSHNSEWMLLVLLVTMLLLYAGYWTLRYSGNATDGDVMHLTLAAEAIVREATLTPIGYSYGNGYGYQVLLGLLTQITGSSFILLQQLGSLWLVIVGLCAYLLYRELLGRSDLAVFSVILLVLQPDFTFYVMRSSHERTTWTFGLLVMWLVVRLVLRRQSWRMAESVMLLLLLLWALIANNAFMASIVIATIWLVLVLALILNRILPHRSAQTGLPTNNRLLFVPVLGSVLVFVFITFAYAPADVYYQQLADLVNRLTQSSEVVAVQLSSSPQQPWISTQVYLSLTGIQWMIALASILAWFRDALHILRGGAGALSRPRWLLWLFYSGFALLVGLGAMIDLTGFLASNLQVRLYTPFALMISPMAATWLIPILKKWHLNRQVIIAGALLGAVALGASALKSSNDPSVGNQWLFHHPGERVALDWVEANLESKPVWSGIDSRLMVAMLYLKGYTWHPTNNYWFQDPQKSYLLLSEQTQIQANRSRLVLPAVVGRNIIYDNGNTLIYSPVDPDLGPP